VGGSGRSAILSKWIVDQQQGQQENSKKKDYELLIFHFIGSTGAIIHSLIESNIHQLEAQSM
jgi:hypothetical protein